MTELRIEGYDVDLDQIEGAIAGYRSIVASWAERLGIDPQKAIALGVCMYLTGYLEDDDRYNALSPDEADALIARMAQEIGRIMEPARGADSRAFRDAFLDADGQRGMQPG